MALFKKNNSTAVSSSSSYLYGDEESYDTTFEESVEEFVEEYYEDTFDTGEADSHPVSPAVPKKAEKRNFFTAIVSAVVCLFLAVLIVCTSLVHNARQATQPDSFLSMLEYVELNDIPGYTFTGNLADTRTCLEVACDTLNGLFTPEVLSAALGIEKFTPKFLTDFIYETTLLENLSHVLSDYAVDLGSGDVLHSIGVEEIAQFLSENQSVLESRFGIAFSDNTAEHGARAFLNCIRQNQLDVSDLPEFLADELDTYFLVISSFTQLVLVILTILVVVVLVIVNRQHLSGAILDGGIAMMLSSVVLLLLTVVTRFLPGTYAGSDGRAYIMSIITRVAMEGGIGKAVTMFIIGAIMTVAMIFYGLSKKKNSHLVIHLG